MGSDEERRSAETEMNGPHLACAPRLIADEVGVSQMQISRILRRTITRLQMMAAA